MRWMLLPLLLGCSDYELTRETDVPEGAAEPDLVADPSTAVLTGHCEEDTTTVTLSNAGSGTLTVTGLQVIGEGWSLESVGLPLSLEPEAMQGITLIGQQGSAVLVVTSDDPDTPELSISLEAEPDAPPALSIESPGSGTVIEEQADVLLEARVSDPEDASESLVVRWSSDVDGMVGDGETDIDGLSSLDWAAAGRTAGSHTVTAEVTDSCGQTSVATVSICQQAYTTSSSVDLENWNYEGDARWDSANDWVELTDTSEYAVGSAFDTTTETRGTDVTIEFQFWMGGGTGADGFALTALDLDRAEGYLASAGGCLGYGYGASCEPLQPALPGWTIEFDTYENSKWDPTSEDHLAFMFDGAMETVQAWSVLPDIEDAQWHTVIVEVSKSNVSVSIDGNSYLNTTLSGYFDFPAHVGFSAATGGLTNDHIIDALTVTDAACSTD